MISDQEKKQIKLTETQKDFGRYIDEVIKDEGNQGERKISDSRVVNHGHFPPGPVAWRRDQIGVGEGREEQAGSEKQVDQKVQQPNLVDMETIEPSGTPTDVNPAENVSQFDEKASEVPGGQTLTPTQPETTTAVGMDSDDRIEANKNIATRVLKEKPPVIPKVPGIQGIDRVQLGVPAEENHPAVERGGVPAPEKPAAEESVITVDEVKPATPVPVNYQPSEGKTRIAEIQREIAQSEPPVPPLPPKESTVEKPQLDELGREMAEERAEHNVGAQEFPADASALTLPPTKSQQTKNPKIVMHREPDRDPLKLAREKDVEAWQLSDMRPGSGSVESDEQLPKAA